MIGRICIPSPSVFVGAFKNYTASFSQSLSQGDFAKFVADIQNVFKYHYHCLELEVGSGCCWILHYYILHLHVFLEVHCWLNSLALHLRNHIVFCCCWGSLHLQCWHAFSV